jgi:motility quorum-sensing regulator / GCU-specific mRNA interferase toxin
MGERAPTYDLGLLQQLIGQGHLSRIITLEALDNAARLGLDESDIVEAILRLEPADFHKSMESERRPGLWQDVYRGAAAGLLLYVKLQLAPDGRGVVIQFKER